MKTKFFPPFKDEGEVIAAWGEARLIKYLDDKLELKGGSNEDRIEAREWISMFLNDAVRQRMRPENRFGLNRQKATTFRSTPVPQPAHRAAISTLRISFSAASAGTCLGTCSGA